MMRHRLAITLLALGCGLILGACGSSSHPKHKSSAPDFIAFSQCMRSHGVPNFPDPGPQGGISINSSSGINPSSPAFEAAQSQCQKLLPGGGPGSHGPPTKQAIQQMLDVSECMRAHGVSGFPDPTTSPPADIQDDSIALGRGGVFLAVPKTIDVNSPVFEQAAAACKFGPGPHARASSPT